jgi:NADH:ubiquinone oxidoreductase subunit F (NADH-binding)
MATIEAVRFVPRFTSDDQDRHGATLEAHLARYGVAPAPATYAAEWADALLDDIESSGLTGRGGAGFPSFKKLRLAQSADQRPIVVANAMESEPASRKDRFLLGAAPHLVLDGAELVALAVNAAQVTVCVPSHATEITAALEHALRERSDGGGPGVPAEIRRIVGRYVGGEESALVAAVAGRPGVPQFRADKSVPLTIGRRPVVVHNVETLANVALIARFGPEWFRAVGSPDAPGTCLVTISGAVERSGVAEVATGTPIEEILGFARPSDAVQAALVGGYGGTWLSRAELATPFAPVALHELGASMGAGVLVALGCNSCGIRETERIVRFMAAESAGQCGPCLFGLPVIGDDLRALADGGAGQPVLDRLLDRCGAVDRRGACRHPDGVVRLVRSALQVFAADVLSHLDGEPCAGATASAWGSPFAQRRNIGTGQ